MKFRALVLPVFVAVLISIFALIAVAIIAVVEQDRIALENERKVLMHATRLIERKLEDLAIDSAWWDVAVENLYLKESTDWADITIGDTITKIPTVDGVLILRPNGDVLYAKIHEGDVPALKLAEALSPLIKSMSLQQGPEATNKRGYVSVLGRTVAYGASMVRPNGVNNFSATLPDKMPVLIFFGSVTQTRLKAIGIENGIRDVAINYDRVPSDGALTLYDFTSTPVATIRWTSSKPGSHLLDRLQLPMFQY